MGMLVPTKYLYWVELLLIHVLVPGSSFFGHLCGILAGLIYTEGGLDPVLRLLDTLEQAFSSSSSSGGLGGRGGGRGLGAAAAAGVLNRPYVRQQQYANGPVRLHNNNDYNDHNNNHYHQQLQEEEEDWRRQEQEHRLRQQQRYDDLANRRGRRY